MSNEISMSNVVSNAMDTMDTMDIMDTMDREWMLCCKIIRSDARSIFFGENDFPCRVES